MSSKSRQTGKFSFVTRRIFFFHSFLILCRPPIISYFIVVSGRFCANIKTPKCEGLKHDENKCNSNPTNGVCEKIRLRSPPSHTIKGTTKDVLGEGSIIVSPQRCQVFSYVVVSNPTRTSSFCCLLLFSISFCVFILLSDMCVAFNRYGIRSGFLLSRLRQASMMHHHVDSTERFYY